VLIGPDLPDGARLEVRLGGRSPVHPVYATLPIQVVGGR
jgi:hypothetical protein